MLLGRKYSNDYFYIFQRELPDSVIPYDTQKHFIAAHSCEYICVLFESTHVFYKKLGSGHSTKSFLINHDILSILVLKFFNHFLIF